MKIGRLGSEPQAIQYELQKRPQQMADRESRQEDKVEISLEGRKKLSELADKKLKETNIDNTPEDLSGNNKLEQIKKKIADGFYKKQEIKEIIADKLIDDIFKDSKE